MGKLCTVTALMGKEEAAMACAEAVEMAICKHYEEYVPLQIPIN
jgi:demethoxyubiquinone hydroxylase (CLK1/Coq7/Cat5 family)